MIEAFPRRDGVLRCGERRVDELARRFGTPLYLYDGAVLEDRARGFLAAFPGVDPFLLAYSVKANGSLALLDRLRRLGCGADVVSGGELFRALRAGIPPERIVFAGVGKTREELEDAVEAGIRAVHVESEGELHLLDEVARSRGRTVGIGIRLNPDIEAPTPHPYTRTGHAASKFGVEPSRALELYRWAAERRALEIRGVCVHIGSQIGEVAPYERALSCALQVLDTLRSLGIAAEYVDLGGGFGVPYGDEERLPPGTLAQAVLPRIAEARIGLTLEPGRAVVAEAGILVTRILHVKEQGGKTFVVADAGMTELLRPSHYGGQHPIEPVVEAAGRERRRVDVVGPICESGDLLGRDVALSLPRPGELMAVRMAGAYGFAMAMQYNGRRRPAEVLVEGDRAHRIRRREVYEDLVRGEVVPEVPPGPGSSAPERPAPPGPDATRPDRQSRSPESPERSDR